MATLLFVIGLFPDAKKNSDWAHLSYTALVLFVSLGLIYINSFFVSVALSEHYRWNVRLTQQMALLEEALCGGWRRRKRRPGPGGNDRRVTKSLTAEAPRRRKQEGRFEDRVADRSMSSDLSSCLLSACVLCG